MPESLAAFQRKLITNEEDSDIMIAYRRILADTYRIWDDIPANSMVNSIMEFLTGCALEGNDSIKSMKVHRTATTWPDFLRAKTGISPTYAFMVFPQYLAGETQNYISNRAFVTGRSQVQTLQDVADRVVDAHNRICQTLEGSELMTWKVFVGGYL
ncbi:hypothetical protein VNI00_007914 [Paramarasmius palmivorus]|uniref:Uncharacterized protein n=1 Tax=Paramarasmius palmivorus TaxID=297713 RepID=A0AAW0CZH1_9AGAR